ncbi:MAG TPA: hypothetical protein DEA85_03565, partial [Firmicutes bacterium]|nr:hypothetical protein [Bacillota bacterium]
DVTLVMSRTDKLEDFEERIEILPNLKAPMGKGDVVGTLSYYKNGELVTAVDLVLNENAEKASFLTRILRYLSQIFVDLGNWIVGLFA